MKHSIAHIYQRHNLETGALILRLLIGITFLQAGWMKLANMAMTTQYFASMGIGTGMTYFVSWVELIAGVLLILGIFIKPSTVAIAIIMAVATWGIPGTAPTFFGHPYEFTLLVVAVALYFIGPGKYTVTQLLRKNR